MAELSTKTIVCVDCAQDFEAGPRTKRCEPCGVEHRKIRTRERTRAWRAAQPKVDHPDPVCQDCGATFEHTSPDGRRTKKYCEPCRKARTQATTREWNRNKRAEAGPRRRTCFDCPADITGTPARTVRCEPCSEVHRRERMRTYLREWKRAQPKAEFRCKTCDVVLDREGKSGVGHYCDECRPAVNRNTRRRATANARKKRGTTWATHCHYCGDEFDKPRQRARTPNRCLNCQRQRHYDYMKVRREAAAAGPACPDCGCAVDVKRKGPRRPRCASCKKKNQLALWLKYAEVYRHMRRAWKYAVGYERFSPKEVYERDGWRCGICRKGISRKLRHPNPMSVSLDHKTSLVNGGPHSRANTQPAHLRCNIRKNKYDALPGEQMPLPIFFG